jgi:hypothetical protein
MRHWLVRDPAERQCIFGIFNYRYTCTLMLQFHETSAGGAMVSEADQLAIRAGILLSQGGTTESGQRAGPVDDVELTDAVVRELRRSRPPTTGLEATDQPDALERTAARDAVARARSALARIKGGASANNLADQDISALELIVLTVGRPAVRFRNGRVETPDNSLADNSRWYVLVGTQREKINGISSRVGRIACSHGAPYPVLGTGWRLGPDLVVTNRHVAHHLVSKPDDPSETWKIDPAKAPFVDFAYTDATSGPVSARIKEMVFCAPKPDAVDLAVLRIEIGSSAVPPPVSINWSEQALGRDLPAADGAAPVFQGMEVYAVGHPYRTQGTAQTEGVFGQADGRKRWAPGLVTKIDTGRPIFLHDSSTLTGNSGSCIVSTGTADHAAVGLHFGGKEMSGSRGTGLGSTNYAVAFARLGDHPAVQYLK